MICFEKLKIEITKDTKAIRQAYSNLLPLYSPEKDPEGFQQLRESYENAMNYAKSQVDQGAEVDVVTVSTVTLSTVEGFLMAVQNLYQDFGKRIDPLQWRGLLEQGICHHIDTAGEVATKLLDFLMSNYRMPQGVWQELDSVFCWTEQRETLLVNLPEAFVNHLFDCIREIHTIEYREIATLGKGAQAFLDDLLVAEDAFEKNRYDRCQTLLEVLSAQFPEQTNVGVLSARCHGALGHLDLAITQFDQCAQVNPSNLDVFFYRGELNFRLGHMAAAALDYERALAIKPTSQGSRFHLGRAYMSLGRFAEAVGAYEILVKHFPGNQEVESLLTCNRTYYLKQLEGELALEPDFDKEMLVLDLRFMTNQIADEDVEKNLETILANHPEDGRAWFRQADLYHNQGAFEEAILAYQHTLLYHEADPVLFNNYGHALTKVGRFDEAIEVCNEGIGLFPNATFILKNRALAWFGLNEFEKAVTDAQKTLQYLPSLEAAYDVCFQALMAQGLYSEVHKLYQKAMDHQAHSVKFALYKADAFRYDHQYEQALSGYEYILEQEPGHGEGVLSLARCHYMLEGFQEGVDILVPHVETAGKDSDLCFDLLGDCYTRLEQPKLAADAYLRAIQLNPDQWRYDYGYGHALSDLEDYHGAIAALKTAMEKDEKALDPLICISYCYYQLADYPRAIGACDKALGIDSQLEMALRNKAWSLYMHGDLGLSHEVCDAFLQLYPDQEVMLSLKVRLYQKQQLKREARGVVEQWLKKMPTSEKAKELKAELEGTVLTRMKQFINTI